MRAQRCDHAFPSDCLRKSTTVCLVWVREKRSVTLEESRRRKRLQERARRRACQVSVLTFLLLGAIAGLGYIGYVAPAWIRLAHSRRRGFGACPLGSL